MKTVFSLSLKIFKVKFLAILTHFGAKKDSQTSAANFFHKMNVQKNFQVKIPSLSRKIEASSGYLTVYKNSLDANSVMFIGTGVNICLDSPKMGGKSFEI